jgi:hypothetical protein
MARDLQVDRQQEQQREQRRREAPSPRHRSRPRRAGAGCPAAGKRWDGGAAAAPARSRSRARRPPGHARRRQQAETVALPGRTTAARWPRTARTAGSPPGRRGHAVRPTDAGAAARTCARSASTASGRLARNSQRQSPWCTTKPPMRGPPTLDVVKIIAK